MTEEELLRRVTAEIIARQDELVDVEFDLPTCYQLIAVLQLACRHPGFSGGPTRDTAIRIAQQLAHCIAPPGSALAESIAMGWDPDYDAPNRIRWLACLH